MTSQPETPDPRFLGIETIFAPTKFTEIGSFPAEPFVVNAQSVAAAALKAAHVNVLALVARKARADLELYALEQEVEPDWSTFRVVWVQAWDGDLIADSRTGWQDGYSAETAPEPMVFTIAYGADIPVAVDPEVPADPDPDPDPE